MFDFARITLAVPETAVGDVTKNKNRIIEKIKEADGESADFIVFPELALTGYTCADLFFQDTLLQSTEKALCEIAGLSETINAVIIVGAPLRIFGKLFNCAVVFSAGRICAIIPKTFIPDYNELSEARWFSSADELNTDEISSSDIGVFPSYPILVSNKLVLVSRENLAFGIELCEDLYMPITPSAHLALAGAEIIFNLSASNETVAKRDFRKNTVKSNSESCLCAYAYVSSGASESTTDLIFSGHSVVCENGKLIAENNKLIDNDYIMSCDIDLGKIRTDRLKIKTFAKASSSDRAYGCIRKSVYLGAQPTALRSDGKLYPLKKNPFIPQTDEDIKKRCTEIFEMQTAALAKRMSVAEKVVIGVSGGLDSTLALLVCTEVFKRKGESCKNVVGITLPCFGTTDRTYNNALKLMEILGVDSREINIKEACLQHFKDIGHDESIKDVTFENVQARERTQVLMDVANKENALVCGTGDLSELALGWCTYNADHMSMYGVNAGVPKTLIRCIIETLAHSESFSDAKDILLDIADTPISPELLPPDESGKIAQKTEDSVGPYELHDFFLYYVLRYGFSPKKIHFLAVRAFEGIYDSEIIKKWLKVFYRRFFTQQFKRSCLPDGVKVGSVGISPRGDLKMPSDAAFNGWIEETELI